MQGVRQQIGGSITTEETSFYQPQVLFWDNNLAKICRCCLANGGPQDIYEEIGVDTLENDLNLFLKEDARLPLSICEKCANFLKDVKKFRETATASHFKLMRAIINRQSNRESMQDVPRSTVESYEVSDECSVVENKLDLKLDPLSGTDLLANIDTTIVEAYEVSDECSVVENKPDLKLDPLSGTDLLANIDTTIVEDDRNGVEVKAETDNSLERYDDHINCPASPLQHLINAQADKEHEENEGEFERENHSFRIQGYPGLDSRSDPESDPLSDGSSDIYQPLSEEDEGSDSDGSICDKSHQRVTSLVSLNTKQHDLHQVQNTTKQFTDCQLQTCLIPQNTTELSCHQQQVDVMPQTIEIHQSQPAECNNLVENTFLMSKNTTELPSHQQQVDIVPQTTEGFQSQAMKCNDSVEKGRNRHFCFYCETYVLNFARHIIRQHFLEFDVQKVLAFPKKSRVRRNLLSDLKKKGNYISNVIRPMRKKKQIDQGDYLPCSNCLGFYARKQLWKHKKKCDPDHKGSQAEAQNLMCRNSLHIPSKSLQKVFNRMRADKVSFVVKQDPIICQFGENYMKIHREKHFIPVTSRKMRELAKLLLEVQKIKPEIKTYFDALKPQNYDTFVAATKIVAKYNESTDRYCSPTYAMNISTSIKQCCNIAIMKILKTETSIKSAEMQADLKTLVQLIESNWKFDVSSNAADDLNLKKWNKVTIVPLASDLKLLKNHLCAVAQNSAAQLREDENYQNTAAYNELSETVFCRALLLNRRRPGELQRLMLSTYVENEHNKEYQNEEFDRTLTATERILVQRLKRIIIRGKRSKGVPVLFSTDVQQDLDLLISLRSKYVDSNNKFLFAKPSSMTCLYGYKVLQKYVKSSGAKNPEAISSTKLRKHSATLTQLFNMSDNDIEQLSNFMGHTTGVHRINYRLPDDIFQTAKISKLLILMEDGKADSFKGKSLDEINLNMEEDLEGEGLEIEDVLNVAESENTLQELEPDMAPDTSATTTQDLATPPSDNGTSVCEPLADIYNITSRSTKKKRVLVPWTSQQKKIVTDHFKRHIRSKKAPKRHECDELKALYPELLSNKDWLKIKVFIQNCYSKC